MDLDTVAREEYMGDGVVFNQSILHIDILGSDEGDRNKFVCS